MWINCVVPLLIYSEIRVVTEDMDRIVANLCSNQHGAKHIFMSAAEYLFVSTNLAKRFPTLLEVRLSTLLCGSVRSFKLLVGSCRKSTSILFLFHTTERDCAQLPRALTWRARAALAAPGSSFSHSYSHSFSHSHSHSHSHSYRSSNSYRSRLRALIAHCERVAGALCAILFVNKQIAY